MSLANWKGMGILSLLILVICCGCKPQGVTHEGRFNVYQKGGLITDDPVDTLYDGAAEDMVVTITLHPSYGDRSTLFLAVNGNDVAELIGLEEDSRTFKLQDVKILTVRYGTADSSSTFSYGVSGKYMISLILD